MLKKKALLIAAGGRALPDVLALFHVQPHLVAYLTSEEGWYGKEGFLSAAKSLDVCKQFHEENNIDAYSIAKGKEACQKILDLYPIEAWDWTFAIGSAPKVMGIAAYEFAKKRQITCLFIDSLHEKLINLEQDSEEETNNLFHLTVADYMKIYRRTYEKRRKKSDDYHNIVQQWGQIAHEIAVSPDGSLFTYTMRDVPVNKPIQLPTSLHASDLLNVLETHYHLISIQQTASGENVCSFTSPEAASFLNSGDWLEVYAWDAVQRRNFADDCRWGYTIADGKAKNELDLAFTYKAQLIIGECKTNQEPFKDEKECLDVLDSIAHLLGGMFVTKVFITNQPPTKRGYPYFKEQADKRHIVVVTSEDIARLGEILEREAKKPTYSRI